jgi:hypothetical protein
VPPVEGGDRSMPEGDGPDRKEISSRDDVLFEQLLDDIQRATASLAVSLKTCRRSSDNPVFRMSAEQQFESAFRTTTSLMELPTVAYDEEATHRMEEGLATFLQLVPQITWMGAEARLTQLFQERANAICAPDRLKTEGRACAAFVSLLETRVRLPAIEPARSPAPSAVAEVVAAPAGPVVLRETIFTRDEGSSHHALVGAMYLDFLIHARGLQEEEARQHLSPAALVGFAQSIDKALAGYVGVVAFRIVRNGEKVEIQLRRLAASQPAT